MTADNVKEIGKALLALVQASPWFAVGLGLAVIVLAAAWVVWRVVRDPEVRSILGGGIKLKHELSGTVEVRLSEADREILRRPVNGVQASESARLH